jgi:uroporphyrinogen-III synthase
VKRLGLARGLEDALCRTVAAAGWQPVPVFLSRMEATLAVPPIVRPDGVLLLSPSAARFAVLPPGVPCLVQGEATGQALAATGVGAGRIAWVSAEPRAEGLWALLRARFPQGGDFLLARGERSRQYLEEAAAGTPWRLHAWITHRERPLDPPPALPELEAVLALSPLQAELLGPRSAGMLRFGWGERTGRAFRKAGYPVQGCCAPEAAALQRMLSAQDVQAVPAARDVQAPS